MLDIEDFFTISLQKTSNWLKELAVIGNYNSEAQAYIVLRSVLQALRNCLSIEQAIYLGELLPMLVRGFYYENWHPLAATKPIKTRADFFEAVQNTINQNNEVINAETATQAVFSLLEEKITGSNIDELCKSLPSEIANLWR